ncbi:MAG TPA: quinone oxidoreductase [Cellulomonas sp.]
MRAIVVDGSGAFVLTETERPTPGPDQVLVEVTVSGVNFMDAHQYRRAQAVDSAALFRAGVEGVGVVVAVGEQVTDLTLGQRVGWLSGGQGSFADYVAVQSGTAVPIPDEIDDETAAALLMQGVTAHYLATDTYPVQVGDPVLVHAAAGGVGRLLTQVAKIRGGVVIGTVSTPEKAAVAREAGADHVLGYDAFAEVARRLTDDRGVAAVYDSIGAATFDGSLSALRVRGSLVVYGGASGPAPVLDLTRLSMSGSLSVTAPMVASYTRTPKEIRRRAGDLFAWTGDGRLDVSIGGRYPLAQAGDAIAALTSRTSTGKLLLTH